MEGEHHGFVFAFASLSFDRYDMQIIGLYLHISQPKYAGLIYFLNGVMVGSKLQYVNVAGVGEKRAFGNLMNVRCLYIRYYPSNLRSLNTTLLQFSLTLPA